jgi:molecular chaperone DnaK
VEVMEGDAVDPNACEMIGDFRVFNLPENLPKGAPIEITYSYDASGRFSARAKELTGNNEAETEIVRSGGMNESEVTNALEKLAEEYEIE